MTISYNIWVGISAWAQSTSYTIGVYVSNSGKAYLCIKSGTSAATGSGPTLTTSSIIDNTVTWQYISNIDFSGATGDVALASAYSGISNPFTQNVIWNIWNTGTPIQTSSSGTAFLNDTGLNTGPWSWTIQAAPGNSIRDKLKTNSCIFSYGNGSNGTSFLLPNTVPAFPTNYFSFASQNVIVSGLMFKDPLINSDSSVLDFANNSCTFQYCILEGAAQPSGGSILYCPVNILVDNCLIIDHSPNLSVGVQSSLTVGPGSNVYNSLFVSVNNAQGNTSAIDSTSTAVASNVINCMIFGYGNTSFLAPSFFGVQNCLFDNPVFPTESATDNGGNIVNKSITAQFKNSNNDFKLISTSSAINAGQNLLNFIYNDDIAYTSRPQQSSWDIGPWEYKSTNSRTNSIGFKIFTG